MKKYLLTLVTAILLSGCAKEYLTFFESDRFSEKLLHNFKKRTIVKETETKAMIHAYYLNAVENDRRKDQRFIVGVYIQNDNKKDSVAGLFNPEYTLTLNGIRAHVMKPLALDSKEVSELPVVNRWSKYYEVHFTYVPFVNESEEENKEDAKRLQLTFSNERFGSTSLNYQKVD
jgi:hypothetical protein